MLCDLSTYRDVVTHNETKNHHYNYETNIEQLQLHQTDRRHPLNTSVHISIDSFRIKTRYDDGATAQRNAKLRRIPHQIRRPTRF